MSNQFILEVIALLSISILVVIALPFIAPVIVLLCLIALLLFLFYVLYITGQDIYHKHKSGDKNE